MVVLFFCPVPEQLPSTWHISAGLQEAPLVTNERPVTPGWSSVGFWWLPTLKYTFSDPIRKSLVTKMFFGFCFLWCWNPQLDLGQSGRGYSRQGWVHTEFFRGSNRLWVLLNQTQWLAQPCKGSVNYSSTGRKLWLWAFIPDLLPSSGEHNEDNDFHMLSQTRNSPNFELFCSLATPENHSTYFGPVWGSYLLSDRCYLVRNGVLIQ